jgi:uracil-DNA glycosylase
MSQFDNALQLLHGSLVAWRDHGHRDIFAARSAMDNLVRAARGKPLTQPAAPPDKPSPAEEAPIPLPCPPKSRTVRPPDAPAPSVPPPMRLQEAAPLSSAEKASRMDGLRQRALVCTKCLHLAQTRTQVVFGVGNIDAELMFVGEAPGEDEDRQGEPFVGRAGELLTRIIEAMNLRREDVYIGNVLKCRPDMPAGSSGNRKPRADEMATCLPYLIEQIEIIRPKVLVALGATAMEGLLGAKEPMNRLRGRWHDFRGTPLMATYHPAYLLRNQSLSEKRKVWEDMLQVLERLGHPISEKQRQYFLRRT